MNGAIEHSDLTEKTYERLRQQILSGRYAVGERLHITTVSEQLGVSHTPVKIALNRLAAEGLVEIAPRRGMFVSRLTRKEIEETRDVRLIIELHALSVAVRNASAEQLAELRAQVDRLAAMVERASTNGWDPVRAAEMNQTFHETILSMVGNRRLLEIWRSLEIQHQIARVNSQSIATPPAVVLQHHLAILEALEARDEERARQAMMDHIVSSMNALAAKLQDPNRS
jgi:DNA-binding GntR family transcriptional regulator